MKDKIFLGVFLMLFTFNFNGAAQEKKQNIFKKLFGVSVDKTNDKFEGTTTYQMNANKVFSELSGANAAVNIIFGENHVTFNTFLNLEKNVLKDAPMN